MYCFSDMEATMPNPRCWQGWVLGIREKDLSKAPLLGLYVIIFFLCVSMWQLYSVGVQIFSLYKNMDFSGTNSTHHRDQGFYLLPSLKTDICIYSCRIWLVYELAYCFSFEPLSAMWMHMKNKQRYVQITENVTLPSVIIMKKTCLLYLFFCVLPIGTYTFKFHHIFYCY